MEEARKKGDRVVGDSGPGPDPIRANHPKTQRANLPLHSDDRFWILFWLIVCTAVVAFAAIAFFHDYRSDLLKLQREKESPVVQTCVHHRLDQKVLVQ